MNESERRVDGRTVMTRGSQEQEIGQGHGKGDVRIEGRSGEGGKRKLNQTFISDQRIVIALHSVLTSVI